MTVRRKEDGFTYAFIDYETQEMAKEAIAQLNGAKVGDKVIKVSYNAKPKRSGDNNNFNNGYSRQNRGDMDSDGSMRS